MSANEPVLVTGANGYLGSHITADLLRRGYRVRAGVRGPRREAELKEDLRRSGHERLEALTFVHLDLDSDDGWLEAAQGARYVLHVASPFPSGVPAHEDEVVIPAREGALRALRTARGAGVERVVLTSSFAAVGYSRKPSSAYTELDWTNPRDDVQPYIKSKTVAEQHAWDFIEREGRGLELAVINPVGIFGPALGPKLSTSVAFVKAMLDGALDSVPNQHFGIVDVRDAAELHVRAMTHPGAMGERFLAVADGPSISFLEMARILREAFGARAERVPTTQGDVSSDGSDPSEVPAISNGKAKTMLGWQPRPARETIVATAESLFTLRVVADQPAR